MDEKDLLNKITKSAEDISPPDSLSPEKIQKKLKERRKHNPVQRKKTYLFQLAAAAAVVCIAVMAGLWRTNPGITGRTKSEMAAPAEAAEAKEGAAAGEEAAAAAEEGAEEEMTAAGAAQQPAGRNVTGMAGETLPENMAPVSSYEEVYDALKESFMPEAENYMRISDGMEAVLEEAAPADGATESSAAGALAADGALKQNARVTAEGDFSETNIQELGVDEGDIVKTDGKYIYALNNSGKFRIISADGGELKLMSDTQLPDMTEVIHEMYLDGNTMNLIVTGSRSDMLKEEGAEDSYRVSQVNYTKAYTYDISSKTEPKLKGSVEQEGIYRTSRKNGRYLYLFTEYYPDIRDTEAASTYIPKVDGTAVEAADMYLPGVLNSSSYLVISSLNTQEPDQVLERKAIVSAAYLFYVSQNNIYICNSSWTDSGNITQIMKFSYKDGNISAVDIADVNGHLKDSFSLNEHKGYLRLVTTDWGNDGESRNRLFVLDPMLNICGKIDNLAPGETIQSARFMGDTGYFVTFRQVDPLFSADLSDPENPGILGELKITGFSSYLHFYGKDKLLGLGNEVDPDSGEYLGIKLSLFNLRDPANVKEQHKYVISESQDCPALYNHKALMIDPDKNIFGFVCDQKYMVFSYDDRKGFRSEFVIDLAKDKELEDHGHVTRGLYIGDTLYLVDPGVIKAFTMTDNYKVSGMLKLGAG